MRQAPFRCSAERMTNRHVRENYGPKRARETNLGTKCLRHLSSFTFLTRKFAISLRNIAAAALPQTKYATRTIASEGLASLLLHRNLYTFAGQAFVFSSFTFVSSTQFSGFSNEDI